MATQIKTVFPHLPCGYGGVKLSCTAWMEVDIQFPAYALLREGHTFCVPFPLPDGWNEDAMEGAAVAILGHERKITVREDRITGSFVKRGCPASSDFSLSEE